ncbi:MAG: transposase [Candidatus Odinarchaeota archaeon]
MFNTEKYTAESVIKPLELASTANVSITAACTLYRVSGERVPSAELVLKQCRDESPALMEMHVNLALKKQFNDLSARLRRSFRKHGLVIVDFHYDPLYGQRDTLGTVHLPPGRSSCRFYSYLTADLWSPGGIFTIAVRRRQHGEGIADMFWDLWARVELFTVLKLLLFDGEFVIVDILDELQEKRIPFVARLSITYRLALLALAYQLTDNWERLRPYKKVKIREKRFRHGISVHVTFQHVHGKFNALIVSSDLSIAPADARELYPLRFAIETGYRDKHAFQIRTCSTNLSVWLFLFLVAIMLWNTWQTFIMTVEKSSGDQVPRSIAWRRRIRLVKILLLRDVLLPAPSALSRR